jgi:hypothetical protein
MQRRAVEARRRNAATAREGNGQEKPQVAPPKSAPDGFLSERLAHTRTLWTRLDDEIDRVLDAGKLDGQLLDRLASARSRLREDERILRREPLPGSLRPTAKPARPTGGLEI